MVNPIQSLAGTVLQARKGGQGSQSTILDSGLATRDSRLNNSLLRNTLRVTSLNPRLCGHPEARLDENTPNFPQQLLISQDFTCKSFRPKTLPDSKPDFSVQTAWNQYFARPDLKIFPQSAGYPERSRFWKTLGFSRRTKRGRARACPEQASTASASNGDLLASALRVRRALGTEKTSAFEISSRLPELKLIPTRKSRSRFSLCVAEPRRVSFVVSAFAGSQPTPLPFFVRTSQTRRPFIIFHSANRRNSHCKDASCSIFWEIYDALTYAGPCAPLMPGKRLCSWAG